MCVNNYDFNNVMAMYSAIFMCVSSVLLEVKDRRHYLTDPDMKISIYIKIKLEKSET
jgi:hypothetical protein